MGCAERNHAAIGQERRPVAAETRIASVFDRENNPGEERVNVAEPNGVLTLRHALALTLMNNPELKAFSLETRAAQARQLQAGLRPNPELEVEIEEFGGTGSRSGFSAAATTLQLSQLIERGDKPQKRKKIASLEKELADLDYQHKRQEIFSEAAKSFWGVLQAQEKLQLSNELLRLSQESFDSVEKKVNAGKDSPLEKIRASVAHAHIQMQHHEARRNLEFVRKELASFWGQDKPLFAQAAGSFDRIVPVPESETLLYHVRQNPRVVRWETEIKKSQAELDLEISRAMGDITMGGGLQRFNDTDENALIFRVSIPLPVSDRNQGAKQAAVYNLAKSKEEQKAAWLRLHNEFNRAYHEFSNAYSLAMSLKQETLPGAMEMFRAATRAYQEGKVDYLNVLDAQRTLFEVKNGYIESVAAYHAARTDIERFIGIEIETAAVSESGK
jgi:cobalt-zinc-cadmium efflux system outer membrane protein